MKQKITAVHLYNDYSGSPKVLAGNLAFLAQEGYDISIHCSDQVGPLSGIAGTSQQVFAYAPESNKFRQLLRFLQIQILLFTRLVKQLEHGELVYINTLLPFGAAIAARLRGCKVIYHLHETSVRPAILKGFLKLVAKWTSHHLVYVSEFLANEEPIKPAQASVIPNSLSNDFIRKTLESPGLEPTAQSFTCLMACSLRKYKGIDQYVELARLLPTIQFELVLNATDQEISTYFQDTILPDNLIVFPRQNDMHWFYRRVHMVLNLSLPDQWVETFGLTLLEGMCYGRPVIGPAVGGPVELIDHRVSGFMTDAYDTMLLAKQIRQISSNPLIYHSFSHQARRRANHYSSTKTNEKWINLLSGLRNSSSDASTQLTGY